MKNRMKEGETEVEERGRRAGEGLQALAGALGRELRFRGYRDPEQQRFGEKEEGRRWEEALSGVCYDLEPLRGL